MSDADAVALFRPARPEALKPFLDLDDASDESDGIYAEELEDGCFLLFTFQPFAIFVEGGSEAHEWLAQFGDALSEAHDDPRGVFFFPDTLAPEATTYAGVIDAAEAEGVWVSLGEELMRGSSFDIAKMFESVQEQLAASFGLAQGPVPDDDADVELAAEPTPEPEKSSKK